MKDQVTSIEQSKRLIELGVPADKASMVWWPVAEYTGKGFEMKLTGEYYLYSKDRVSPQYQDVIFKAFTVADLLGLFKSVIFTTSRLNPNLEKTRDGEWYFEFGEITGEEGYGFARDKSLVDLLVGRIEWIVSNGYKLNI